MSRKVKRAKITLELDIPLVPGYEADKDVLSSLRDAMGDFQYKIRAAGEKASSTEWKNGPATAVATWKVE